MSDRTWFAVDHEIYGKKRSSSRRQEIIWLEQRLSWNALTLCCRSKQSDTKPQVEKKPSAISRWTKYYFIFRSLTLPSIDRRFSIKTKINKWKSLRKKFHSRSRTPRKWTEKCRKKSNNYKAAVRRDYLVHIMPKKTRRIWSSRIYLFYWLFTRKRSGGRRKKNC